MNIPPGSNGRRQFVKKSLAASVVAAQPTILAGLLRADGGSGGGTTTGWQTTLPMTTLPPTTGPWGTNTTFATTLSPTTVWETGTTVGPTLETSESTTVVGCGCHVEGQPIGINPAGNEGHRHIELPDLVVDVGNSVDGTYSAKVTTVIDPADGIGGSVVTVTATLFAWKHGEEGKEKGPIGLEGTLDVAAGCAFESEVSLNGASKTELDFDDSLILVLDSKRQVADIHNASLESDYFVVARLDVKEDNVSPAGDDRELVLELYLLVYRKNYIFEDGVRIAGDPEMEELASSSPVLPHPPTFTLYVHKV